MLRSMPSSQSRPEAPPTLQGRYRLVRTIAASEHGASFLGYDMRLHRWRTIDVPADEAAAQRLTAEAELLARLEHPAVERVVDVGDDGGVMFVVRDRLHGTASEHMPMSPALAANLILRIADGLSHAHSRGIFHGHVRPSVLRFAEDGGPVLTGFGRRPKLDGHTTGRTSEPWAYLAPEQRGTFDPSPPSEVYALGALMYTLVVGRSQADLFYAESYDGLLAPIPVTLRPLILKACAYNPGERPPDVEAFRNLLGGRVDQLGAVGETPWRPEPLPVEGEHSASTFDSERKRLYTMPKIERKEQSYRDPFAYVDPVELPDYLDPVARSSAARPRPVKIEPPPQATPRPTVERGSSASAYLLPALSGLAVFAMSAVVFVVIVTLGLGAIQIYDTYLDKEFVSAVLAERSLVESLASSSDNRDALERAWFRFSDDPSPENAAAYANLAVAAARKETAPSEAKASAQRLEAALDAWRDH